MSAEEQQAFDRIMGEIRSLKEQIDAREAADRQRLANSHNWPTSNENSLPLPRVGPPPAPSVDASPQCWLLPAPASSGAWS